ncbi:hypothetical protein PINS_up001370 [Pythium insidiosum]|nr:hypothetical protein PINS_up001370 [Pythium insidiosum]
MTATTASWRLLAGATALLAALGGQQHAHVEARGLAVNLTASWPSSRFYPLLETSEFLAEENPLWFWRYVDALESHMQEIDSKRDDVSALSTLAVDVAQEIAPHTKNILELSLSTRTYSVKVEMFRQLALDSGVRPCGPDVDAWAVFYREKQCAVAVACRAEDIKRSVELLTDLDDGNSAETCVATGLHDVELDRVDHKYPQPLRLKDTVILYGLVGSKSFYSFHNELKSLATARRLEYIVRHYPKDADLETLLQGYGVSLDIKNMEYKTIDDSKKVGDDEVDGDLDAADDSRDDDDDDDLTSDEDVDGVFFSTLMRENDVIAAELKGFRDQLVKQHDQHEEIKAWQLKDLGLSATREILDAKNPLKRLRVLSQDFPRHAKKLALSRKSISDDLRSEAAARRSEVQTNGLLNRFLLNGILVDPMQRSFNIFDFMKTLKAEWSIAKKLAQLPLSEQDRETMLENVREAKQARASVRIRVRGPVDGTAPLYINNIETDLTSMDWPSSVAQLRRPAWNLIFLRKNMYEYVVAFDPVSPHGRQALSHIAFMRMRGAPIQWGLLASTKELVAAKGRDERDAIVKQYKDYSLDEKATGWHFAKLVFMARAKDAADDEGRGRAVSGFIEGVADESGDITVQALLTCYVDATGGAFTRSKSEKEAVETLKSSEHDDSVMSMTEYLAKKHLPFECSLFNGVLKTSVDLQSDIMSHFGRDQPLYQAMARQGELTDDMDLIDELLTNQGAYPSYFSLFGGDEDSEEDAKGTQSSSVHLFGGDENKQLEDLVASRVTYMHQDGTITSPKKQTLLFWLDLGDRVHAAHVYEAVKAVQEDMGSLMRVGVVHRLSTASGGDGIGELVAGVIATVGDSDNEKHIGLVIEALRCVVKGKTVEATKSKMRGLVEKIDAWDADEVLASLMQVFDASADVAVLSDEARQSLQLLNEALRDSHGAKVGDTPAMLFLNGFRVDLPVHSISNEDISALTSFDLSHRSQPVAKAFIKRSGKYTRDEANARSMEIVKACAIIDEYRKATRYSGISQDGSLLAIKLPGDQSLRVTAYVDPLSEAAQRMSSLIEMLHSHLNASVELMLVPSVDYSEFPLQRFYRFLFDKKSPTATKVSFRKLPIKPILTMKIDTPEAWNVQIHRSTEDLDNLRVDPDSPSDVRAVKTASFRLENLLVYGQCRDKTFEMYSPPNGLQLVLERDVGSVRLHRDTLVMKNLGYFQLQATPGVWDLHLARGRAVELYEILDAETERVLSSRNVIVSDFGSHVEQLLVRKRQGMEHEELLAPSKAGTKSKSDVEPISEDAGLIGSYWNSMLSLFGKKKDKAQKDDAKAVATATGSDSERTGETIHVFSLATGHLYERFLKIMMSSVLKRTKNPVTFWLLENFLSPDFKDSIPALRQKFGMDIRLVTYKWPNWLRQQTQKQRIIWGYKILFLDVLFPLGVQKIIYVDADQVVRADLKELWEMDLKGSPYGYTPFCDSRNVGYQFWRQGYWKDHLRGRPYHISALYVVDLALFRQMAAGDILRAIYDQLSADPNSLANLDQDLPNYAQHQISIFSLPQEWLWCESWCSDESKANAKTIDLCNNPKHKEPKLDMAKRVISGELFQESWLELDQEIREAEQEYVRVATTTSTS